MIELMTRSNKSDIGLTTGAADHPAVGVVSSEKSQVKRCQNPAIP